MYKLISLGKRGHSRTKITVLLPLIESQFRVTECGAPIFFTRCPMRLLLFAELRAALCGAPIVSHEARRRSMLFAACKRCTVHQKKLADERRQHRRSSYSSVRRADRYRLCTIKIAAVSQASCGCNFLRVHQENLADERLQQRSFAQLCGAPIFFQTMPGELSAVCRFCLTPTRFACTRRSVSSAAQVFFARLCALCQ